MARFDTIAVYLMTNKRGGSLYLGVTSDLITRVSQHRIGEGSEFTKKYKCRLLMWYEVHDSMRAAKQRETSLKRYLRQWKIDLIEKTNPNWDDLWPSIIPGPMPGERSFTVEEIRNGALRDVEDDDV